MSKIARNGLFATLGLILTASILLAGAPVFFSDTRQRITRPLAEVVPSAVPGWSTQNLDVADSEEMRSAVVRILQYDDVLYRSYRRQGTEVQVYVAYWKPGSVPYGQAGVHTPDTCWVNAGWTMDAKTNSCEMTGGPRSSKPGEWRQFSLKGTSLQVFFWHLVGDRVHTYDQYGWRNGFLGLLDRVPNLFRDIRRYGFNLAQEQLFIRISSNVDFDTLKEDPAFGELLSRLDGLGFLKPTAR